MIRPLLIVVITVISIVTQYENSKTNVTAYFTDPFYVAIYIKKVYKLTQVWLSLFLRYEITLIVKIVVNIP